MPSYKRLFIPNSYLFLTVTTNYRQPILIDNIKLLRESFQRAKVTYKFDIISYVILPDHMHIIIHPENVNEYPKIIFGIKYHFSRNIDGGLGNPPYALSLSKVNKKEKGIWQRRYYEHTITNEDDLNKHLDYIHYNPVKHGYVRKVMDWEFSSFDKFVKTNNYNINWGSAEDIEHIEDLKYD